MVSTVREHDWLPRHLHGRGATSCSFHGFSVGVPVRLEDAEAEAAERRSLAAAHLGTLAEATQPAAMHLAGISLPTQLTALACERLGIVVDCHELGVLRYVEDTSELVVADDAFDRLLATHGGSKKALLDAAKEAATLYGLKRPASSSQVATSPMLFAATFMATPNQ